MSECPKCGRIIGDDGRYSSDPDVAFAQCRGRGDIWCMAFGHGMRAGLAIAKEHASVRDVQRYQGRWVAAEPYVDWTDAYAELERRLRGET